MPRSTITYSRSPASTSIPKTTMVSTVAVTKKIEPVFLTYSPKSFWYLALKIRSDDFQQTLAFLDKTWHRFIPEHELNWMFLTNGLWNKKYRSETRFSHMVIAFACIAITIACLGLFGLASFTVEQRKKEIGVRKMLGASVPNLLILLIKANVIAWPIVYMLMQHWLKQFAYRIDIDLTLLFAGGLLALLIALITVIYQTLKATQTNPIETLRCE